MLHRSAGKHQLPQQPFLSGGKAKQHGGRMVCVAADDIG